MKKALLIYRVFRDENHSKGILLKMQQQSAALERLGYTVDTYTLGVDGVYKNNTLKVPTDLKQKLKKNLFLLKHFFSSVSKNISNDYDFAYIRYAPFSLDLMSLFKKLKQEQTKVFLELATYPYIGEYSGIKKWLMRIISNQESKFHKYVDQFFTLDDRKHLFDIPCTLISNGIHPSHFPIKTKSSSSTLRLLFVGNLMHYQGVDRVILGIKNYVKLNETAALHFDIVGKGTHLEALQNLVSDCGLTKQVTFHGNQFGKDLDTYFNENDIAIGKLAMHRINFNYSSGLKHREYCVRGIPFVYAATDDDFEDTYFTLKTASNDNPIAIEEIWKFKNRMEAISNLAGSMNLFANENLTWDQQMAKVIALIEY